jgi:hypothetical protein
VAILRPTVIGRVLDAPEVETNFNFLSGNPTTLTISGGIITTNGSGWYRVDTEALGSVDELTRINGVPIGETVQIYASNAARTVVVKNGANLKLIGAPPQDFALVGLYSSIVFRSFGSDVLVEMGRNAITYP